MTRILVVDDKEMMRDSVGAMLSSKGHSIVVAASAPEAIETAVSSCREPLTVRSPALIAVVPV